MDKRKLNEIEYLNWLVGQPYNIAMAITIRGNFQQQKMRVALNKIQEKHPLLQAQLDVNKNEEPLFIWGNISEIPLTVDNRSSDDLYKKVVEKEFTTLFETGKNCSLPLIRVKILFSEDLFDLIITMQHVIADGMSMVFLFMDILSFIIDPKRKDEPLDIVKSIENVLPYKYQKKIPKTTGKFKRTNWFLKRIIKIYRFKNKLSRKKAKQKELIFNNFENKHLETYDWVLSEDQSQKIIERSKENQITVQSTICTMFLSDFPIINNPVNLRDRLAYNVGRSIGCYAGGLVIKKKYKNKKSFWKNAQLYHKKLTKGLQDKSVFSIFKLFSRSVKRSSYEKFTPMFLELASRNQPFGVTNLGSLDRFNIVLASKNFIIENLYGGVSGTFDALVITIFTIEKKIHFHFHYYKPPHSKEEIVNFVSNAMQKLENAVKLY
ncbi:MAG: condensation domain-containing protein [Candidatus Thorarchaeota archaeon]